MGQHNSSNLLLAVILLSVAAGCHRRTCHPPGVAVTIEEAADECDSIVVLVEQRGTSEEMACEREAEDCKCRLSVDTDDEVAVTLLRTSGGSATKYAEVRSDIHGCWRGAQVVFTPSDASGGDDIELPGGGAGE